MRYRFAAISALLVTGAALQAANVFTITGPSPFGFSGQNPIVQAWTQTTGYNNVTITMPLEDNSNGGPIGGVEGTVYLTNQIGPGTTTANEVAPPVLISGLTATFVTRTLFTGLSLPPGTYYLVLFTKNAGPNSMSPEGSSNPVVSPGAGVLAPGGGAATTPATYPPATAVPLFPPGNIFVTVTGTQVTTQTYYFSQLAFGGGFQTTLTYVNYSPQTVTCVTNFYSDSGAALPVPFGGGTVSSRTDILQPGQVIHDESVANLTGASLQGWGQAACTAPVQASVLYRYYQSGVPAGEASVIAETIPTNKFVTFAQTATGVAYANPSASQASTITLTVISAAGVKLGTTTLTLGPLAHGSANLGPLLGLQSFTGFVEIVSTTPIISLSLNAEAFPVFSSLPPGDLPGSATLISP